MSTLLRRLVAAPVLLVAAVALSGCQGASVPTHAAPLAAAPECAEVSVRLPETVDGLRLRLTNAQATGAWGDPASVILRCGVESPGPSTERCVSLDGVDWIEDASKAPTYLYTSYGRTPAVEVLIDTSADPSISGTAVLMDLKDAVTRLPETSGCVGADDLLEVPDATPTPTGTDPVGTEPTGTGPSTTP